MEQMNDGELIRQFHAARDEAAFAALVQRHQGLVFAVCRSVLGAAPEADDAAQATFLVLANKASSLVNQPSVAGWLHRVAWNIATRAARDVRLRQQREQEAAAMMAVTESGTDIPRDQLHEALAALPDKYRQALVLRHIEGCSEEETARLTGCGLGAMSARLSRARDLLRQKLVRRGIGVASVGAMLAALTAETQAAAVPATFAAATAKAAAVTGTAAAGVMSASAVTMAQGALHMLWLAKVKLTALIVVAATVLASGGTLTTVKLVAAHRAKVTGQIRSVLQPLYDAEAKLALPTRVLELPRQWGWRPFDPEPVPPKPNLELTKTIEQITWRGDKVVVIVADRTAADAVDETGKRRTVEQRVYTEEHWERQADGQWKKILIKPAQTGKETK